jgi:hypothetical protein
MTDKPDSEYRTVDQSVAFVRYFAGLGGAAVIVWLVRRVANPQLQRTANMGNPTTKFVQSQQWFETLLTNLPILFLLLMTMGTIAFVVYQTRFA